MNTLNLKYFCAVVKEMNITKAAEKLHVSQQTLSSQIAKLETEYNILLFERVPKLHLTYAGERFLEFALKFLEKERMLITEFDDICNHRKSTLSIGIPPTRSRVVLPQILPIFFKQFPNIKLNIYTASYKEIEKKLINGDIDVVISVLHENTDEHLNTIDLMRDHFCLIIPTEILKTHFSKHNVLITNDAPPMSAIIKSKLLQQMPYILVTAETQLHFLAKKFFKNYNISPNILFEASDLEVLWDLSVQGMASTFVYEEFARKRLSNFIVSHQKAPVVIVPLNLPGSDQRVVLSYHKKRYISWSMKKFINLAKKTFSQDALSR